MSKLSVEADNRVRLVAAVLAASQWPDMEQSHEAHAVHPQAKLTRHYLADHQHHPVVLMTDEWLSAKLPIAEFFNVGVRCRWADFAPQELLPSSFPAQNWATLLADFYVDTAIAAFFWSEQKAAWLEAVRDVRQIFHQNLLPSFLSQLLGKPLETDLVIVPNLTYPTLQTVIAGTTQQLFVIIPPPKAVGESAPWAYREGVDWVLAEVCMALCRHILAPILEQLTSTQQTNLLHAAVVLFLEQALSPADGTAYLTHSKQQHKLPQLPQLVDKLREQLQTAQPLTPALFNL